MGLYEARRFGFFERAFHLLHCHGLRIQHHFDEIPDPIRAVIGQHLNATVQQQGLPFETLLSGQLIWERVVQINGRCPGRLLLVSIRCRGCTCSAKAAEISGIATQKQAGDLVRQDSMDLEYCCGVIPVIFLKLRKNGL